MTTKRSKGRGVATLHAVAKAAGVSIATTSKALNGIQVSAENYAKIHQAAEELGYVPNEAARAMRGGKSSTIGLVVHMDMNPNTELMAVLHSQIRDFEQRGYSVLLSVVEADASVDVLLRKLLERRVDGVVYWNALDAPSLAGYRRAGIPVIAAGYRDEACAWMPMVNIDATGVFEQVYSRLHALGHRRVAEVSPGQSTDLHNTMAREFGLHYEYRQIGFSVDQARTFIESLRIERDAPTALFASYATAVQLLAACEELGVQIPGDLSIVSMTDSDAAPLLRTPLSALRMDYERFGHAASEAMFAAIDGEELDDIILPGLLTWIDRSSLGPRSDSGLLQGSR